ncbi:hypothetical protein QOZ80_4AG0318460 [Eleusine coracana subsp. coracana]|nr:hypothetical protein QOZ80_4AG0318460 [Eleusine coracana subsp. coracana]
MPAPVRCCHTRAPATSACPPVATHGTSAATYPPPRPMSSPAPPLLLLPQFLGPRASAPTTTPPAMADVAVADGARSPTSRRQQQPRLDDAAGDHHQVQDVVMLRRTRSGRSFPPPISVIGRSGRPWLRLRASWEGGRLVLREMRLPSQELLQPCKEDGRFKLLIHMDPTS